MLTLLNVMLPPPSPPRQLHHQSVKLQLNRGSGGCFPLHFDSDAALDGRRVTALTYLNPDWTPGDGGELVLYPFPEPPVKVEPVMGRVVLFSAANMLHRVLPSGKPRMCYTTWFFAKSPRDFRGRAILRDGRETLTGDGDGDEVRERGRRGARGGSRVAPPEHAQTSHAGGARGGVGGEHRGGASGHPGACGGVGDALEGGGPHRARARREISARARAHRGGVTRRSLRKTPGVEWFE